jgi:hypothetical protein
MEEIHHPGEPHGVDGSVSVAVIVVHNLYHCRATETL